MESSNSGPVYGRTAAKKFGFSHDLLTTFEYLKTYKKFQKVLSGIYDLTGPFKYEAELFPVLTHESEDDGSIIFVATKYDSRKLGKYGAFVLFKTLLWNDTNFTWYKPVPSLNETLLRILKTQSKIFDKDWKIYTNDEDLRINANFNISLGKVISSYLSSDNLYQLGVSILKSRRKTNERIQLLSELSKVRTSIQNILDLYANKTSSILGHKTSDIEGVILRIKASNGDIFEAKGTSHSFHEHKDFIWEDRTNIINLEMDFEFQIIKEVLLLRTQQPAALNSAIKVAAENFISSQISQELKRKEFISLLLPSLLEKEVDFDSTKFRLGSILSDFEEEYNEFLTLFKQNKIHLDNNSIRKTKEYYSAFKTKFDKLKNLLHSPLNGSDFYFKIFDAILGFRIDKIIDFDYFEDPEEQQRPKVIIWNRKSTTLA